MDNIPCRVGEVGYWSCEDCSCPACVAAVNAQVVECDCLECELCAEEGYLADIEEDWFFASCDQGTADPVPTEFGQNVDLIHLELVADRLAGHRTSYLAA